MSLSASLADEYLRWECSAQPWKKSSVWMDLPLGRPTTILLHFLFPHESLGSCRM